jgi:hypothetical protein
VRERLVRKRGEYRDAGGSERKLESCWLAELGTHGISTLRILRAAKLKRMELKSQKKFKRNGSREREKEG